MRVSYPAMFDYTSDDNMKYFLHLPDFKNSAAQVEDMPDELLMAADWLGIMAADLVKLFPILAGTFLIKIQILKC